MVDSPYSHAREVDAFVLALTHDVRNKLNNLALQITDLTEQVAFDPTHLDPLAGPRLQDEIQRAALALKELRDWVVPELPAPQVVPFEELLTTVAQTCEERSIPFLGLQDLHGDDVLLVPPKFKISLDLVQIGEAFRLMVEDAQDLAPTPGESHACLRMASSDSLLTICLEVNALVSEELDVSGCGEWGQEIPALSQFLNRERSTSTRRYRIRRLMQNQHGVCTWSAGANPLGTETRKVVRIRVEFGMARD